MRASIVVAVALSVFGCKKEKAGAPSPGQSPTAPASTAEQDALWALAPPGAEIGIVASSRALAHVEGGALAVKKVLASAPELARIAAKMDAELQQTFGTTNITAADLGLTVQKGFAMFKVGNGAVAIVPVGDRDKFLKVAKGTKGTDTDKVEDLTCKTVQGFYACASDPALLDQVGKKSMPDAMKLVGTRGDIELAGTVPQQPPITFAAAVQLGRGAAVVRAAVKGLPPMIALPMARGMKPRVDPNKTTGFAIIDLSTALPFVPAEPLVPGVTADQIARTVSGPVTISIEAGQTMVDLRIPLSDPAPAQKLVDQCDTIPPLQMMGASVKNGVCQLGLPQLQMDVQAWTENKELRIGKKVPEPSKTVPLTAVGKELGAGEWAFAFYGRGSMLAMPKLGPLPLGDIPDEGMAIFRALALLNELGMGMRMDGDTLRVLAIVRTAWANPDDVVTKLLAITPEQILRADAASTAKAIADGAKGSPFAADHAAGWGGLVVPTAGIGMLAAVAIPAFMEYTKKAKTSEWKMVLSRLEKNLKVVHATTGEFPKGKAPLSPSKSCCDFGPGHKYKCDDAAAWKHPVWQSLDFELDDPHLFRYSYESDGKTFAVKAVGDMDCDGTEITFVLSGKIDAQGGVTTQLDEPAPDSD